MINKVKHLLFCFYIFPFAHSNLATSASDDFFTKVAQCGVCGQSLLSNCTCFEMDPIVTSPISAKASPVEGTQATKVKKGVHAFSVLLHASDFFSWDFIRALSPDSLPKFLDARKKLIDHAIEYQRTSMQLSTQFPEAKQYKVSFEVLTNQHHHQLNQIHSELYSLRSYPYYEYSLLYRLPPEFWVKDFIERHTKLRSYKRGHHGLIILTCDADSLISILDRAFLEKWISPQKLEEPASPSDWIPLLALKQLVFYSLKDKEDFQELCSIFGPWKTSAFLEAKRKFSEEQYKAQEEKYRAQ